MQNWEPRWKSIALLWGLVNTVLSLKNINQNVSDTLKVLEIFQSEDVLVYI